MKRFNRMVWNWQYRLEELRRYDFNTSNVWHESVCCVALGTLRIVSGVLHRIGA